ncbi:MAG TPA: hypothetical protein VGM01_13915 [Ktedonobacteraceae bacterium]|jgi:hypothetical protein
MAYVRQNAVGEQEESCQKAQQLTEKYRELQITLDPIDWQQFGMWAPVKVNTLEIASLHDLWQRDGLDLLRQIQMKLLEQAALEAFPARPERKAVMWSPVEVIQPQEFLSLWIITFETGERIPVIEFLSNGQRVYAPFQFDGTHGQHLAMLFGPAHEGEYRLGDRITIKEREHQYTGEIIYIISPSKIIPNKKQASRRYHTVSGAVYTNDVACRYIIDCSDGFPHIAYQSQIVQ